MCPQARSAGLCSGLSTYPGQARILGTGQACQQGVMSPSLKATHQLTFRRYYRLERTKTEHRDCQRTYSLPSASEAKAEEHGTLTMLTEPLVSSGDLPNTSWELPSGPVSPIYRPEAEDKTGRLQVTQPQGGSPWIQAPTLAIFLTLCHPECVVGEECRVPGKSSFWHWLRRTPRGAAL